MKRTWLYCFWFLLSAAFLGFVWWSLDDVNADRTYLLPGDTTHGHHQIEMACNACHTEAWGDGELMQEACEGCHADALKEARDSHPMAKFTDPRNADRIEVLDARYCVTCHIEHRPEMTNDMGVTLPDDYCVLCHEDIAEDRESHAGMPFDTCASAGCHNYHDNRALYERFLVKHGSKPELLARRGVSALNFGEIAGYLDDYPSAQFPVSPLSHADADAPLEFMEEGAVQDWLASPHAAAGVNCSGCHSDWQQLPDETTCQTCHSNEVKHFFEGLHGMRRNTEKLGIELSYLTPGHARLPMKAATKDTALTCNTCHSAHTYQLEPVESCLSCHNDEHSLAYPESKHYEAWQAELKGALPEGQGVTCATCHMPRIEVDYNWGAFTHVMAEHNQSATLLPNEKMIRPVCMNCHGLAFSIDALADEALIQSNFNGRPAKHIESIDMAIKREQQ